MPGEQFDINLRAVEYKRRLEMPFNREIAQPWFDKESQLFLQATGAEELQNYLGPTAFLVLLFTCHVTRDAWDPIDHLMRCFGLSIAMGVATGDEPEWDIAQEEVDPEDDLGTMVEIYWEGRVPIDRVAATLALRYTINQYRNWKANGKL